MEHILNTDIEDIFLISISYLESALPYIFDVLFLKKIRQKKKTFG